MVEKLTVDECSNRTMWSSLFWMASSVLRDMSTYNKHPLTYRMLHATACLPLLSGQNPRLNVTAAGMHSNEKSTVEDQHGLLYLGPYYLIIDCGESAPVNLVIYESWQESRLGPRGRRSPFSHASHISKASGCSNRYDGGVD